MKKNFGQKIFLEFKILEKKLEKKIFSEKKSKKNTKKIFCGKKNYKKIFSEKKIIKNIFFKKKKYEKNINTCVEQSTVQNSNVPWNSRLFHSRVYYDTC